MVSDWYKNMRKVKIEQIKLIFLMNFTGANPYENTRRQKIRNLNNDVILFDFI